MPNPLKMLHRQNLQKPIHLNNEEYCCVDDSKFLCGFSSTGDYLNLTNVNNVTKD